MRTGTRLLALAVLVVCLALWFFGGMNRGWTKTSVELMRIDEVTELSYSVREQRFLPGLDFLAAGGLAAALLWGSSFLFRKK